MDHQHDGADIETFLASRWSRLLAVALASGLSRADAEDAVQTALAKVVTSWDKVRGARNPDAYVARMVLNSSRDIYRRRARREPHERDGFAEPSQCDRESIEQAVVLRAALAQLSVEHRAVVILKYTFNFTDPEIGEVLSIPVGTVKSRLSRGLRNLQTVLASQGVASA
ncbi:RNA polymerase sigma factor [Nocardioides sp. GXZ039]|uniref:RNA polymerase sigma factor n=1 Tax=Nocardioides sp. GXZ039 TaxID=3136018 RepID=UPI0030F3F87C